MGSMREAYEKIGADYNGASVRLMGGRCSPALPLSSWMTRAWTSWRPLWRQGTLRVRLWQRTRSRA